MAENLLLSTLSGVERRRVEPYFETVALEPRTVLCEPGRPVPYLWFPLDGVCSSLVRGASGEAVEVGLIGNEGMVSLTVALGSSDAPFQTIVQVRGSAIRVAREPFEREVLRAGSAFVTAMQRFAGFYISVVGQTAACNRLHRIEQRLSRWMLEAQDRLEGDTLPITHEFLALMVGAYRPSVSNALQSLEERGVVRIGRGKVTIVDRNALEREACDCRAIIQRRLEDMLANVRTLAA